MRHIVAAVVNLLRLQAAGFEGLAFVIGPLLAGWHPDAAEFGALWLVGVLINGYIFALNDLVDLARDRLNPAKARSPLVTGALSERFALLLAVLLPLAAMAVDVAAGWSRTGLLSFAGMAALGAFVNVYQKLTGHPIVMDGLFAVTMAAPIPVSTAGVGLKAGPLVWIVTAAMLFLSWELNSIAGNCKDLRSDQQTGFRTVAVSLGADVRSDGTLRPGRRYAAFCWSVHVPATGLALLAVLLATAGAAVGLRLAVGLGAVLLAAWGTLDLRRLLAGRRPPSRRGRERYFAAGGLLLLVAVAARADVVWFVTAMAVLAAWEVTFVAYWSWYWAMPASAANR